MPLELLDFLDMFRHCCSGYSCKWTSIYLDVQHLSSDCDRQDQMAIAGREKLLGDVDLGMKVTDAL